MKTSMHVRNSLAVLIATLCAGPGTAALAQEAPSTTATTAGGLEEIIVTAQRREQDLQTVPLAITAVSGETLERLDIRNASDLDHHVPGLSLCCQRGEVQYPYIRGVPGVKGYFAEVPAVLDGNAFYFDLANVQVLKGPQGTLFGTATNGGAILNEPRRPTDTFEGYVGASVGDYGRQSLEGVVNFPINERLQVRAGIKSHQSDGYIKDHSNGEEWGDEDYMVARVGVNFDIMDTLNNYLVANWYESKGVRAPFVPYLFNPDFPFAAGPDFYSDVLRPLQQQQRSMSRYDLVGTSMDNEQDREILNIVNQTRWDVTDWLTVRNIFGYSETKFFSRFDADGTPFPIYDSNIEPTKSPDADEQITEELQFRIKALDDRLELMIGTFNTWFDAGTSGAVAFSDLSAAFGILTGADLHESTTETHAYYADATWDASALAEGLTLIAGVRRTRDTVDLEQTNSVWVRIGPGVDDLLDLNVIGAVPHTVFDLHDSFEKTTYRVGVQYQLNDDTQLYLMNSKGYSSGGFNLNNPPGAEAFDPESLDNWELGIKSEWALGNVQGRTNLSLYWGKYDDIQVSSTQAVCTDPNDSTSCRFGVGIFNAATGEIKGGEVEFALIPVPWLEVGGNAGYSDAEYTDYEVDPDGSGPLPSQSRENQPFVYVPEWKCALYARVDLPIPAEMGMLSFTANYQWQDDVVTTATATPQVWDRIDSYANVDASLDWSDVMGYAGLGASLFGTNLGDNETTNGGFGAYQDLGLWGKSIAVPRQFGLRVRYDF